MTDQKQPENMEYFTYLGTIITKDARCTAEIKSRIITAKAAFNNRKALLTSKMNDPVKCYIWSIALYGAETRTLRKAEQALHCTHFGRSYGPVVRNTTEEMNTATGECSL
jgi:hypothetical protein